MSALRALSAILATTALSSIACSGGQQASQLDEASTRRDASSATVKEQSPNPLLSAFFGLDNKLPAVSAGLCPQAPGLDGVVLNVADELDGNLVKADQFLVTTSSGRQATPTCATLRPANDPGERRTVLLIGELGEAADLPVRIDLPTGVPTVDPERAKQYIGASLSGVTPIGTGPRLVIAEQVDNPVLGGAPSTPDGCPNETAQVIRVAWEGGVTRADGLPTTHADADQYHVSLSGQNEPKKTISPVALADINDFDNYHMLCLNTDEPALAVSAEANSFVSPNNNPNPETTIAVAQAERSGAARQAADGQYRTVRSKSPRTPRYRRPTCEPTPQ